MFRLPIRVQEDAANKPTAAQAYQVSGTATTGYRTFASQLTDGDVLVVLAEEIDANGNPAGAWETCIVEYDDLSTDELKSRTLIASSSGSLIDWSTSTGIDATPRLTAIFPPEWDLGGWERVSRTAFSATNTAAVEFTGLSADHEYLVKYKLSEVASGSLSYQLLCQLGYGSTTWHTGGTDYGYSTHGIHAGSHSGASNASGSALFVGGTWYALTDIMTGCVWLPDTGSTGYTGVHANYLLRKSYPGHGEGSGILKTPGGAVNALKLYWGGGYNMRTGEFELWRRRKAYGLGKPL